MTNFIDGDSSSLSLAEINKEWFSVDKTASFLNVPSGGVIHIIGICGIAMAQLALSLVKQGYIVSGSDTHFYDPMGGLLQSSSITLFDKYEKDNIPQEVDLVVIANAMFPDNPEVNLIREKNLPYSSFPLVMGEWLIGKRHSIVICGTHGKTTTTGIAASILFQMKKDPSWFIGGLSGSLPETLHQGTGDFSVIEGDEYHTAFYAKRPKFFFYKPQTVIINAIEFDHGDIYKDVAAICFEFKELLMSLQSCDKAICCIDYPEVRKLLAEIKDEVKCKILTFGTKDVLQKLSINEIAHKLDTVKAAHKLDVVKAHHELPMSVEYLITNRKQCGTSQVVTVSGLAFENPLEFTLPMIGSYNALNAVAAISALSENGILVKEIVSTLAEIKGVSRRQQILFENDDYVLIEDFAHHPTAVKKTVLAVAEAYPDRRIWAVFEPRSNTSRRKVFEEDYKSGFEKAAQVIICNVTSNSRMNDDIELIDVNDLAESISQRGTCARALPDSDSIYSCIAEEVEPGDLILIMSNGDFGHICKRLTACFSNK